LRLEKPLRELSATEIICRSFSLYSRRPLEFFAPFFFVGILNGMMRQATRLLIPEVAPAERLTERFLEWSMGQLGVFVGVTFTAVLVFWITNTIASGITVRYTSDLLERGVASLTTAFNFAAYRLSPLLVASVVSGVLMILGLICFVVPGIIVVVMFSLIVPAIMIENRGAFESLERSRRLVDRSWWKTFTILLLVLLVTVLLSIMGEAVSVFFGPFRGIASGLLQALVQPIQPLASTYLYYSMRIKETRLAQPVSYKPLTVATPTPPLPIVIEQPRFCIQCGQKLPTDAVFCPNCGNRIRKLH